MAFAIPDSPEGLQELLADDAKRTEVFADPESTKEFLNKYSAAVDKSGDIAAQVSESVQATITDMLKEQEVRDRPDHAQIEAEIAASFAKPGSGAQRNAAYNKNAPGAPLDGVVNSLGEMARLINPKIGKSDAQKNQYAKLEEVRNAYSSADPASAGFLIPEAQRAEILQLALEQSVVRSRATVITMNSLTQKIPFVDSTSHASSVYGGMVFYWTEESAAITATEAKFGRVELSAKKLTGGARIPNELWNDAAALGSWMMQAIPAGIAYFEDDSFFGGNGVGQPLGFNTSDNPAVVAVSRNTASTIKSEDIFAMYARMLPQSLNRAVWIANPETVPSLLGLQTRILNAAANDYVGGSDAGLIQGGSVAGAPAMTILGRPLIVTEKAEALNTAGDFAFVDLSHYLIGDRQAISLDSSEHSRFMNDETELRIIERVDGRPWLQSAITPRNGTATLSAFVQVAAG